MIRTMRRGVLTALGGLVLAAVAIPAAPTGAIADDETCVSTISKQDVTVSYTTDDFHAHVEYIGTGTLCAGVSLVVSLNSYSAEGPTWPTSGTQVFVDHDQFTIDAQNTAGDLQVTEPPCFYQTDLYWGATLFNGIDGPLPHYPDTNTPTGLIAHRGGGSACEQPPVDASGSFTVACNASGAAVSIGTLSSEPGVTWALVVNGTAQLVSSGQSVQVPSEASLTLSWTLDGKSTVEQVATAPKACPPPAVTPPSGSGTAPVQDEVVVKGEKSGAKANPPAVLPKTGASSLGLPVASALLMLLVGSFLIRLGSSRR